MTVTWVIELDVEAPERVRADVLVAPLLEQERPLRGAAGRLDWRLCGHLSEMVRREAFDGSEGEVVLVPTVARARAPRALLVGVGPRQGFGPRRLRGAVERAVLRAAAMRAGIVAVAVPSEAACGVPVERLVAAALVGAGEAMAARPAALRLRLVVEPEGLARARRVLAELVPRIELEGVIARLSSSDLEGELAPPGASDEPSPAPARPEAPHRPPQAKPPFVP